MAVLLGFCAAKLGLAHARLAQQEILAALPFKAIVTVPTDKLDAHAEVLRAEGIVAQTVALDVTSGASVEAAVALTLPRISR